MAKSTPARRASRPVRSLIRERFPRHSAPCLRLQPRSAAAGKRLPRRARTGGKRGHMRNRAGSKSSADAEPDRIAVWSRWDSTMPFIAADHVPAVLEYKPIGLEGFDGMLVDFMQAQASRCRRHCAAAAGQGTFCWWSSARGRLTRADAQATRLIHAVTARSTWFRPLRVVFGGGSAARVAGARVRARRDRLRSRRAGGLGGLGGLCRSAGEARHLSARSCSR